MRGDHYRGAGYIAAITPQAKTLLQLKTEEASTTGLQAQQLAGRIAHVEDRIDALVYALYGLSGEEVGLVEGSYEAR